MTASEFLNCRQFDFVVASRLSKQLIREIFFFLVVRWRAGVAAMSLEALLPDSLPPVFVGFNFV
eukprot:6455478-Amphidinium_carterae.2